MASSSSGSKRTKGLKNLLKETLHVRSRSKSPSQVSDSSKPSSGPATDSSTSAQPIPIPTEGNASISNTAWARLRGSLQSLKDSSTTLDPLPSVIETLMSCLGGFEDYAKNLPNCEELAIGLATLSDSVTQHMRGPELNVVENAVFSLVISLEQEVRNLKVAMERRTDQRGSPIGPTSDFNHLAACYGSVQSLFQKLEINLRDSISSGGNEETLSTLLEGLSSTKNLRHDSITSTNHPRTCTKGTRTEVLTKLDEWIHDPTAAPVFWMSGTEGTGKTAIARTFCEHLNNQKILAASMFLTCTINKSTDTTRIVPIIAYQLARYSAPFRLALCEALSEHMEAMSKGEPEQFELLILRPLLKVKYAMPRLMAVVVDGLGGSEDRNGSKFAQNMFLRYAGGTPLRLLVMSRQKAEPHGVTFGDRQPFATTHLDDVDPSTARSDIERYFRTELGSITLTAAQLRGLADRTDGLFLCATILVRFIRSDNPRSSIQERLQLILSMTHESIRKHAYIDMLYTAILRSVLGEEEGDNSRVILWTVLFAQEAIRVETIGRLGGIDDPEQVRLGLQPLSAVLCCSEEGGLVSALHSSFAEYMLDSERSGAYFYDIAEHSRRLVERCFEVMKSELRFNICGLESSFVVDREVEDIDSRIEKNMSATLVYACRYWADHLELAAGCDRLLRELEEFYSVRLLFWMEVLSLKRDMRQGVIALMKSKDLLKLIYSTEPNLVHFAEDAWEFVTSYAANPVSQSTPHIYVSALPFCPRSSQVYERYSKLMTGLLDIGHCLVGCGRTNALSIWHRDIGVSSVAYSPKGDWIAFGYWDGTVEIRDAYTGSLALGPLQCHDSSVSSITFSPDSSKFATGILHSTAQLWDATDGTSIGDPFLGHTSLLRSATFSPNGTFVALDALHQSARTWNVAESTIAMKSLAAHFPHRVLFSPDGSHIAAKSDDNSILVWDISVPTAPVGCTLAGHSAPVRSLAFFLDGQRLVSSGDDGFIRTWDIIGMTLLRAIDCRARAQSLTDPTKHSRITSDIRSVDVSPDGRWVVTAGSDRTVRVWNIDDGTLVAGPFTGHLSFHISVSFSPDGARVVSYADDRTVRLWSVREGMLTSTHDSRMFDISSITFSPSGSRIYTTSPYGVSLWDANDGSLLANVTSTRPQSACSLPISRDGTHIVVFLDDHSVKVLSTKDRSRVAGPFRGHTALATCAAFSADGAYLVTGSEDCTVRMWSMREGEPVAGLFTGHTKAVMRVSVSRDGSRVASYSLDGTIRVWNTASIAMKVDVGSPSLPGGRSGVLNGWTTRDDGWVANGEGQLLFWIPLDFPCKLTPETEVVITQFGSFSMPKHEILVGEAWKQCYAGD